MAGPLSSLKVLDFSTLIPGPVATQIFADLGADVIRVESLRRPDPIQFLPPISKDDISAAHASVNRSKRSIALSLKSEEGIEIVKKLIPEFDIVIEQFRPGVMDKLGVGYEDLKAINPKIIYCSITGYGQDGPYKDRAGHDINYLAMSGAASYTGRKEHGPTPFSLQIADVAGGSYHGVMGILAAVIHRQVTGEGQYIDISMTDAAFSMHALAAPGYLAGGERYEPRPEETLLNGAHFYDYYKTKDGRYLSVGSLEPQFYMQFIEALGGQDIFPVGVDMKAQKKIVREIFTTKDFAEWRAIFANLDACVEPVLTLPEAVEHPHVKARGLITELEDPKGGDSFTQVASAFKFSKTKPEYKFPGVAAGTHSSEILRGVGYSEEEITNLRRSKTID